MKSKKNVASVAGAVCTMLLAGCGTVNTQVRGEIDQIQRDQKSVLNSPVKIAQESRVSVVRGTYMPVTAVKSARTGEWLKRQQVQLEIRNPTPISAVVSKFADQGINITSELPLDSYTYTGKVNPTDGETALKAVLGSVGLDYQVDDARRLVVIKPMASRSWYISIGNRKSSYATDGQSQSGTNPSSSGMNGNGNGGNASAGSPSASPSMGGNSANSGGDQAGGAPGQTSPSTANGTGVAASDDFWSSLAHELSNRLSVMIPRNMAMAGQGIGGMNSPQMPMFNAPPQPNQPIVPSITPNLGMNRPSAAGQNNGDLYLKRQIGTFSMNPETGAITVQAPHWVLAELDTYMGRVQEMYNTDISFMGEVVLVTSNRNDSEGFDIAAFTKWAGGRYGAVISNNALGGVTMSLPPGGGMPAIQAATQAVAGPLLGLTYRGANNALDIFNAYLSEIGKVSVIQRPLVTTTSGVPGVFSKKYDDYYNTVSQQAAAGGTGSAATATQNVLVKVELGTELRINPRIDISTGLIRAQLTLNQAIKSGVKNVPQTITFGNNATTVNSSIPLITKQNISGEILLRDGDLIVVGGQTEDNSSVDENGLPGQDGPLGGMLGVKKANRGAQTYYFALRVAVNKRQ